MLKKCLKNDRRESILRRFILKVIYVYTWKIAKNKAFRRFCKKWYKEVNKLLNNI